MELGFSSNLTQTEYVSEASGMEYSVLSKSEMNVMYLSCAGIICISLIE
jgi:hypothetical protein